MATEFDVSELISSSPEVIYAAWFDSEQHSKMTGSPAEVSAKVGHEFGAWMDRYVFQPHASLFPESIGT